MNDHQLKLIINFSSDIKRIMLDQMRNGGFYFNSNLKTEDLVRQYFNLRIRQIEVKPRKIHISRELLTIPVEKLNKGFATIIGASEKGLSLNPFLSSEILNPESIDQLLYDWGIHHLHLGHQLNEKDRRFITRTRELIFVRVESDELYCIDILDHDPVNSFSNKNLIEIIHNNWPHLLLSSKVRDKVRSENNITNEQIYNVRQAGALTFISTTDGTTYMPPGGGYSANGSSLMATQQADMLLERIFRVEEGVKADDSVIRKAIIDSGVKCPITIKLKLTSWDELGVLVTETKSKLKLRLLWAT